MLMESRAMKKRWRAGHHETDDSFFWLAGEATNVP